MGESSQDTQANSGDQVDVEDEGRALVGRASQRNVTIRWTREEHAAYLKGLERFGTGHWSSISKLYVPSRTPAQVASHHQKFAIRSNLLPAEKQKPSILDITTPAVQKLLAAEREKEIQLQMAQ
ncbi:hypothetical protein GUITHDRAFT_64317 [Guillardia theta CCMP2712]|uniref:Uncharacterized protein n=2 Tax=Guillardia theta TaxID=55529 RepID=L1JXL4_GUITC|nr:hypothetical protein GUITHDRAFT_64317 [Guillardia theta CCMP2712]EKX53291.1 hypothetical protein GUITHDRAFT_64317 [Guillardia theta CCMP2712]|eukprot:XP_005840271.1 hypothetical protein GUITHDRAFT_64317 [Guillardia theta CCMP2712]